MSANKSYEEKVDWLFHQFPAFQKVGEKAFKPTLSNTEALIQFLKVPYKQLKYVHVAGTNGKGTTCSIIASALTESGLKVGLFTSPHIKDFRERIRINGEMISAEKVEDYIDTFQNANLDFAPSFFEMTWVMALAYFSEVKCDIVVVETGLGGRLDATNLISPEVSVITNIGLDHVNILGDTEEAIAEEKAGIIKKSTPVYIGEDKEELRSVFTRAAKELKAPITFVELVGEDAFERNRQLAFAALDYLLKENNDKEEIKSRAIQNLYKNTGLYGRFQEISSSPLTIVDAAHNVMGVQRFINAAKEKFLGKTIKVVYGASNDKDLDEIVSLFPLEWEYHFTEFANPRSYKLEVFQKNEKIKQLNSVFYKDSKQALISAQSTDNKDVVVLVFGSFFLLEEII